MARKRRSVRMAFTPNGTVRASGMWWRMKASICSPASSNVTSDERMASSSPLVVCMFRTTSSMASSAWGGWVTTRSGPSATISSSSSVINVAISTMACRVGSRPVISRSIHTSTGWQASGVLAVPVVRLDTDLPLPAYARPGDAGCDLLAREDAMLRAGGGRTLMPTGIAIAIPEGYAGFVQPRSGLAFKHGVTCLNTPGLIDSGFRDELRVLLINTDPDRDYEIRRGDRIAQLVIQRVEHVQFEAVDQLPESARGTGGFGHTGR